MSKIVLQRTGEQQAVAFHGKRILFETETVGCSLFEFHGYVSRAPIKCYVLATRERRRCSDNRAVSVFDDRESFEKGLAAARGLAAMFRVVLKLTMGPEGPQQCAICPRGGK